MQVLKTDHPLGCGALYQFRDHKKLGLSLGVGLNANELRLNDVRAVFPSSLFTIDLRSPDNEIKLIFRRGYRNYQLIDKFIAKNTVVAFVEGKTLWTVKHILFLQHSEYREITLQYLGLVDHSDE